MEQRKVLVGVVVVTWICGLLAIVSTAVSGPPSAVAAAVINVLYFAVAEFVLRRGPQKTTLAVVPAQPNVDRGSTVRNVVASCAFVLVPLVWRTVLGASATLFDAVQTLLVLVMLAAAALRFWAMHTLGEMFSRTLVIQSDGRHNRHRIITHGPYAWVRHPGYLANILLWAPYALLLTHSVLLTVAVAVFAVVWRYRIEGEEQMLASDRETTGVAWEAYTHRTKYRLLPGVW
eukprot:EC799228.1.p2 GENE.EC799228.1~~EC799228.1.p2  ORF type:complete len:232 (+),score=78.92 EC799228.1:25-720(+)